MFRKVCFWSLDCVENSVRPAAAGKGIVGRGDSNGVVEMGVSSGGTTKNGRQNGKRVGPRKGWETLWKAPQARNPRAETLYETPEMQMKRD